MENIIILRSAFKITKAYLNPAKNPLTGRYPECVRMTDSKGDMILSREDVDSGKYFIADIDVIEIEEGKTFNLDDEVQNAQWEAIKFHSIIAKARDERDGSGNLVIDGNAKKYGNASWYVEVPGLEATEKNKTRRLRHEAHNHILNDTPEERKLKALVLGKQMKYAHDSDVEDYLMQEADKSPSKIINLYTGGDLKVRLLFMKGREENLIIKKDGIWVFGESTILGSSEESAILFLKQAANKKVFQLLESEIYPEKYTQKK